MEPVQPPLTRPAASSKKQGNKGLIIALIVVILIGVGIFMLMRKSKMTKNNDIVITPLPTAFPTTQIIETPAPEATPSAMPTKKPSPTAKPTVKSAYDMSLQILNGNGEVGVAGKAEDFLKGKGYKYFETGNADNYDYSGVTVKIKSSMNQYLATLQKDLSDKYTLASNSGTLSNDAIFDAVIIVGK